MYRTIEGIKPPEDTDTLWRYMSLEKLVNILKTESLFFTRADKFDDPFEGFIPAEIRDSYKKSARHVASNEDVAKLLIKVNEDSRKYVMCNCWHQNQEESMAMWDKYHMRNSGIAIETTMRGLKNSLLDSRDVFIGEVEYFYNTNYDVEYKDRLANNESLLNQKWTYFPYFHKRRAFQHEREVRMIIDIEPFVREALDQVIPEDASRLSKCISEIEFPDICKVGKPFKVDVNELINKVIISPYCDDWITETVESVVHQYGFDFGVNSSILLNDPTL